MWIYCTLRYNVQCTLFIYTECKTEFRELEQKREYHLWLVLVAIVVYGRS